MILRGLLSRAPVYAIIREHGVSFGGQCAYTASHSLQANSFLLKNAAKASSSLHSFATSDRRGEQLRLTAGENVKAVAALSKLNFRRHPSSRVQTLRSCQQSLRDPELGLCKRPQVSAARESPANDVAGNDAIPRRHSSLSDVSFDCLTF